MVADSIKKKKSDLKLWGQDIWTYLKRITTHVFCMYNFVSLGLPFIYHWHHWDIFTKYKLHEYKLLEGLRLFCLYYLPVFPFLGLPP